MSVLYTFPVFNSDVNRLESCVAGVCVCVFPKNVRVACSQRHHGEILGW